MNHDNACAILIIVSFVLLLIAVAEALVIWNLRCRLRELDKIGSAFLTSLLDKG